MVTVKKQYYGIKFPFTSNNLEGFFLDLNTNSKDKVISEIAHVILTPKRSRIHCPEFGTNLIKFIFDPNDEITWDSVVDEVRDSIRKFVPNAEYTDMKITKNDESIFLDIQYTVKKGNLIENNRSVIKL